MLKVWFGLGRAKSKNGVWLTLTRAV